MGMVKRYLEDLSVEMGYDGEITDEVLQEGERRMSAAPAPQAAAESNLIDAGAVRERREDRDGKTKSGWWLDTVYLGSDARTAWEAVGG